MHVDPEQWIEDLGGISRQYLGHGHEAMFASGWVTAPMFTHRDEREAVAAQLRLRSVPGPPDVADALVTSSSQLLVNGKLPGSISMFVWDRANVLRRFEVNVQRDLARLSEQIQLLFPNEQIQVGMPVIVEFEQHDDVALPKFRPA